MTGTAGEISGARARYYDEPRTHARHHHDFYIEPFWTVALLLNAETFPGPIYDPACGSGTIPVACEQYGYHTIATDLVDRGYGDAHGIDFVGIPEGQERFCGSIICNPPYRLAEKFVRRALAYRSVVKVAMLMQSKFPYSQARFALFAEHPPARLYFLSTRPSMPPGDELLAGTLKAEGGKLDYCWIVWDEAHTGPTEARWLKLEGKRS